MRRRVAAALLLLFAVAFSGCTVWVRSERVGEPQEPKPEGCAIVFSYDTDAAWDVVFKEYPTQVGVLTLERFRGPPDELRFTDSLVAALRPEACRLGGDFVMYSYWYANAGADRGRFLVFRKK